MQRTALQTSAAVLLQPGGGGQQPPRRRRNSATKVHFRFSLPTAPPTTITQRPQSGPSCLSSRQSTSAQPASTASIPSTAPPPAQALDMDMDLHLHQAVQTGAPAAVPAAPTTSTRTTATTAAAVAVANEATVAAAANAAAAVAASVAASADAAEARRARSRENLPQSMLDRQDMREARKLLRRREFAHRAARSAQRVIPGNPAGKPQVRSYMPNRPLTHHAELRINNTVTESVRDVAMEDASHWRRNGTGTAVARSHADRGDWITDMCHITNVGYHSTHRSMVNRKSHGGAASSQLKSRAQRFPPVQARFAPGGTSGSYLHMRPGARVPAAVGPGTYDVDKFYEAQWLDKQWNLKNSPHATTFGRSERTDITRTLNGALKMREPESSEEEDDEVEEEEDRGEQQQQLHEGDDNAGYERNGRDDRCGVEGSTARPAASPASAGSRRGGPPAKPPPAAKSDRTNITATTNNKGRATGSNRLVEQPTVQATSPRHDSSSVGMLSLQARHWRRHGAAIPKAPLQSPWRPIDHDIPGPGAYGKMLTPGAAANRRKTARLQRKLAAQAAKASRQQCEQGTKAAAEAEDSAAKVILAQARAESQRAATQQADEVEAVDALAATQGRRTVTLGGAAAAAAQLQAHRQRRSQVQRQRQRQQRQRQRQQLQRQRQRQQQEVEEEEQLRQRRRARGNGQVGGNEGDGDGGGPDNAPAAPAYAAITDDTGRALGYSEQTVALKVGRHRMAAEGVPVFGLVGGSAPVARAGGGDGIGGAGGRSRAASAPAARER